MVLIVGCGLGTVEPEWVRCTISVSAVEGIGIVVEQPVGVAVHCRGPRPGVKAWLSARIQRLGIGAEVVVERDIFLKDDDKMLDRGTGPRLRPCDSWVDE